MGFHKPIVLLREGRRDKNVDILAPQLVLLPIAKDVVGTLVGNLARLKHMKATLKNFSEVPPAKITQSSYTRPTWMVQCAPMIMTALVSPTLIDIFSSWSFIYNRGMGGG